MFQHRTEFCLLHFYGFRHVSGENSSNQVILNDLRPGSHTSHSPVSGTNSRRSLHSPVSRPSSRRSPHVRQPTLRSLSGRHRSGNLSANHISSDVSQEYFPEDNPEKERNTQNQVIDVDIGCNKHAQYKLLTVLLHGMM